MRSGDGTRHEKYREASIRAGVRVGSPFTITVMEPRKLRVHDRDDLVATKLALQTGRRQQDVRPSLPTLLDITMLADHLGVTPRHVRRLIAERRIPYLKWGRLIRFDPDEIADWLDCARKRAAAPSPGIVTKPGARRNDGQTG